MSIRIEETPEPLSEVATHSTSRPILAESDAYRLLVRDMERYVLRQVSGRSFLISGHRGSGKTTLVLKAVHDLRERFRGQSEGHMPLLVRLQGPALLPDPRQAVAESRQAAATKPGRAKAEKEKKDGAGAPKEGARAEPGDSPGAKPEPPPPDPEVAMAERALRQITLAIYRALAAEFSRAYGGALLESVRERLASFDTARLNRREWEAYGTRRQRELEAYGTRSMELAAQFRLALDDAPGPALLRELYRLGGFLESGVLFSRRSSGMPGQGLRELVVLATAAQAYRVVSGDYEWKQTAKSDASDEVARERAVAPSGSAAAKDLVRQLLALFFGGATGAAVLAGERGLAAAVAAVAAAAAASFTLKLTASRSRKRAFTDEYSFIRSHDASTLERELPVLVERLHDAGLAPIFLVDELDKVDDLPRRMESVVDHLKHFVSEGAFFCFLTDRDYFEHLRFRALKEPYPREHTYFTDRLFIAHRPEDWHSYLDQILTLTGSEPADLSDKPALGYYLLHQSRMHPVDLRRELRALRGPTGDVLLLPGEVRSRLGCRFAVAAQLAVELVLGHEDVKERLEQEPGFAQPMFDALYYPSRMWAEGGAELTVSKAAFVRYLAERMAPNRPRHEAEPPAPPQPKTRGKGAAAKGKEESDAPAADLPISSHDVDFLLDKAAEVAALLADLKRLAGELQAGSLSPVPSEVIEAIPLPPPDGVQPPPVDLRPLEPVADGSHIYRWRYDAYGIALPGTQVEAPRLPGERASAIDDGFRPELDFIKNVDAFVREVSGGTLGLYQLADTYFVLSRTPSWPQVQLALMRLDGYLETQHAYADRELDRGLVSSFGEMLRRRSRILALSLAYGAYIGRRVVEGGADKYLARGVAAVSQAYGLRAAATDESTQAALASLEDWLGGEVPPLAPESVDAWVENMKPRLQKPADAYAPAHLVEANVEAWKLWEERLRSFLVSGERRFEAALADLFCLAAEIPPSEVLPLDLSGQSLNAWTTLLRSIQERTEKNGYPTLEWTAVPALLEIGLGACLRGELPAWLDSAATREWIATASSARPRAFEPRPSAVVILSTAAGAALFWKPSERFGAGDGLTFELEWALDLIGPAKVGGRWPSFLFIELPLSLPESNLAPYLEAWQDQPQSIFLLASQESDLKNPGLSLSPLPRAILGVRSLDEAMNTALRLLAETSPPPSADAGR